MRSNSSTGTSCSRSITWASVAKPSNSLMSAPTMKPFSLPERMTRPTMSRDLRAFLDARDDGRQLLQRTRAQRVGARAFTVEDGPGDALLIDAKAPVVQDQGFPRRCPQRR